MALTAQKTFEKIKNELVYPELITSISNVSPCSAYADCNSSFTIYALGRTMMVNTTSVKKSNMIVTMIEDWRKKSE